MVVEEGDILTGVKSTVTLPAPNLLAIVVPFVGVMRDPGLDLTTSGAARVEAARRAVANKVEVNPNIIVKID